MPFKTKRQRAELLAAGSLDEGERMLLRQVESRISARDTMYNGDGAHYFNVGLSALRCVEEAVESAQLQTLEHALDLPCGHGRVLRFLAQRFPQAKFTASDLDRDGVDFCARTFGAAPVYSQTDLDALAFEARFDLIWCGSLITHLDAPQTRALLRLFARHLRPGGLMVFTAHGDFVARRLPGDDFDYMLTTAQVRSLSDSYTRTGFGYTDYAEQHGYGVSLTSPVWIREETRAIGGLREVYFRERAWDAHHDVYGYVREA